MAASAGASHCEPSISPPDISTPTGHYIDYDVCQPVCLATMEIWQESNGIDGLQTDEDAECAHSPGAEDTLILRVRQ